MAAKLPPSSVLAAFGVSGRPVALEGCHDTLWRIGETVLKPIDRAEQELAWEADVFASIACDGFRIAHQLRAADGSLVVEDWCAWEAVEGANEEGRWPEIIAVGDCFHSALAGVPRPEFIARRTDPNAIGDRVAWGDLPASEFAHVRHLTRLSSALKPTAAPSQVIHGDLTGNVLFDDHLPPAVIDFTPYFRPTAYASAIVVADAVVWEDADENSFDAVAHIEDFEQYLLRALIYRTVTDCLFGLREPIRRGHDDPYLPAVELACRFAAAA